MEKNYPEFSGVDAMMIAIKSLFKQANAAEEIQKIYNEFFKGAKFKSGPGFCMILEFMKVQK